jgi:predicted kinase
MFSDSTHISAKETVLQHYEPLMLPIIRAYDEARRERNELVVEEQVTLLNEFKEDLGKQMIILVGAPASGKSFFVETTLGKWVKGNNGGLTKSFPRLTFHANQKESDNALRQMQWGASKVDFKALSKAEDENDFNAILKSKEFQYTSDGKVRRLADILTWESWLERKNKIQNFLKRRGDPVNSYYASMRGRDSVGGEELKKAARKAFEDRVEADIKRSGDLIVIDSAGEDIGATPFDKFFTMAKEEGFMVSIVELNIPLEMSLKRNDARGKKGRAVPASQVEAAYNAMARVVKRLRKSDDVDRYVRYVWEATGDGIFDGYYKVGVDDRKSLKRKVGKLKDLNSRLSKGEITQAAFDKSRKNLMSEGRGGWLDAQEFQTYRQDSWHQNRSEGRIKQKFGKWLVEYYTWLSKFSGVPLGRFLDVKRISTIMNDLAKRDVLEYDRLLRFFQRDNRFAKSVAADTWNAVKPEVKQNPVMKRLRALKKWLQASEDYEDNLTEAQVSLDYITDKRGVVTVFDRVSRKEVAVSGEEGKKLSQELSNATTPQALTGLLGQYTHLLEGTQLDENYIDEQTHVTPVPFGSASNRNARHATSRYPQARGGANFQTGGRTQFGVPTGGNAPPYAHGEGPPPPPQDPTGGNRDHHWYDFTDVAPDGSRMMSKNRGNTTINISGDVNIINEDELDLAAQVAPRVMELLKERPRQNYISVSETFGVTHGQSQAILKQMVREGLLTDIGGGFVSLPEVVQHELKTQKTIRVGKVQNVGRGVGQRRAKWGGGSGGDPGGGGVGGQPLGGGSKNESVEEDLTSFTFTTGQAQEVLKIMKAVGLSENMEVRVIGDDCIIDVPQALATHLHENLDGHTLRT